MASAHYYDASMSFTLVKMDGIFRWLDVVYNGFWEFGMPFYALGAEDAVLCRFMPFYAVLCCLRWGQRMLYLICHSALALSVAIWVYSYIKPAVIPASSALFVVFFMLVPPGFTVVILLD
jgi:hypothetical protein